MPTNRPDNTQVWEVEQRHHRGSGRTTHPALLSFERMSLNSIQLEGFAAESLFFWCPSSDKILLHILTSCRSTHSRASPQRKSSNTCTGCGRFEVHTYPKLPLGPWTKRKKSRSRMPTSRQANVQMWLLLGRTHRKLCKWTERQWSSWSPQGQCSKLSCQKTRELWPRIEASPTATPEVELSSIGEGSRALVGACLFLRQSFTLYPKWA